MAIKVKYGTFHKYGTGWVYGNGLVSEPWTPRATPETVDRFEVESASTPATSADSSTTPSFTAEGAATPTYTPDV